MSVHSMKVAAVAAVLALSAAGYADEADQANPDSKALLEYVKKLESRVNQLETERDWPLDQVRGQSESALESAVRAVNLSGYMEFQYGWNIRHGGRTLFRGDTLGFNNLRGSTGDENGFSFQNLQLLADKPLAAMNSTGFRVRAEFGQVSQFDNRDMAFNGGNTFDVREAYMSWRMDSSGFLTNYIDLSIGKFDSPLGIETPDAADASNYGLVTRDPFHTGLLPITHTGLRAVMPWQECSKTTLYFVNGWDNVRDAADGKTVIASHEMGKYDWLNSTITINGSYGNEGSIPAGLTTVSPDGNKTWLGEIIWRGELDKDNTVALDGVWANMDHSYINNQGEIRSGTAKGLEGYIRHQWSKDTWVSGRLGYHSMSVTGPVRDLRGYDISLAVGWNLADDMTMALEYRHDHTTSDIEPFATKGGSATDNQDTVTASFVYRF